MGFGFNLFFIFILIPLSVILSLLWLVSRKKLFGKMLGLIWICIFGLVVLVSVVNLIFNLNELDNDDIYGEYIIDRNQYPGKQSDWQYDHFRFEITENEEMKFHLTENKFILKTLNGKVHFLEQYKTPRIVLNFDNPKHHILLENPTLFKKGKKFYYVFYSEKFGNVFFRKGKWKKLE